MVYSQNWDSAYEQSPGIDELLRDTLQQTLTGLKLNIRERMSLEHHWGEGDSDGRHFFPTGSTASRDDQISPVQGMVFFNGERWTEEFYSNGGWTNLGFLSGCILLCGSAVVPLGWSLVASTFNDRVIRINSTAQGGLQLSEGGSWTISGLANHAGETVTGSFTSGNNSATVTTLTGGGATAAANQVHTHATTVTFNIAGHTHVSDGSWRPAYVDMYLIQKN